VIVRPCQHCPFTPETRGFLRPGRVREIVGGLSRGGRFPCHKTVDYGEDGDGNPDSGSFCAGALLFMERTFRGGAYSNQMVRIEERFGGLDLDRIDTDAESFRSLREMIAHHAAGDEP
jgi:hypothetical protein